MRAIVTAILAAATLLGGLAVAGEHKPKLKKPKVTVRALPQLGTAPVEILVIVELKDGDEVEELYCPELEMDWDDGGKSIKESDCAPFEPGVTKLTRRFTVSHLYRRGGVFDLRVLLRRADKTVAAAHTTVIIRAGVNEPD
jgi:hypothetical protein